MEGVYKSMSDNTNSCKKGNSSQPLSDSEARLLMVRDAWNNLVDLILCKKRKAISTNNMTKDYGEIIKKINIIDPFINEATLINPDNEAIAMRSDTEAVAFSHNDCDACPFYHDPLDD